MVLIRSARPALRSVAKALTLALSTAALSGVVVAAELRSVQGLATPESVVVAPDGRIFVSQIGEFGKDGDGKISVIAKSGKAEIFASGFDDPKGLAASRNALFVADKTRVWKVDMKGQASVFAKAEDFPQAPLFLNDLVLDAEGNLYVSDTGDIQNGGKGAIFKIDPKGKVSLVISEAQNAAIKSPNGLLFERKGNLLVVDFATGELLRLNLAKGAVTKLADGFGGGDGLARDAAGLLFVSDWKNGKVWKFNPNKPGAKPVPYAQAFKASADISLSRDGRFILVPDMKAGALVWLPK